MNCCTELTWPERELCRELKEEVLILLKDVESGIDVCRKSSGGLCSWCVYTFVEYLLYAKHCSSLWGYISEENHSPLGAYILAIDI